MKYEEQKKKPKETKSGMKNHTFTGRNEKKRA